MITMEAERLEMMLVIIITMVLMGTEWVTGTVAAVIMATG